MGISDICYCIMSITPILILNYPNDLTFPFDLVLFQQNLSPKQLRRFLASRRPTGLLSIPLTVI